ncbi:hypothetical protein ACXR0O_06015 [Verrucomicrobiota bacterium sgz303538]
MDEQGLRVVLHGEEEASRIQALIDAARTQLADLEAACTVVQKNLQALRASLFERLAPKSRLRDKLRLLVRARADLLDSLRRKDEESAAKATEQFKAEWTRTEREYDKAAAESAQKREVSPSDEAEIATLWRKLVKLYHPDKLAQNPEKQETYHKLIAAINHARDKGDLATLREIAADPHGFLLRKGWGDLDLQEDRRIEELRKLLKSLEAEIERVSGLLARLKKSPDYELHQLIQEKPEMLDQMVEKQERQIDTEMTVLEAQAESLKREVEKFTGEPLAEEI